jgi:hypothetical protein
MNNLDTLAELLDNRTELDRQDERFEILATVRAVFGDDVEVIEFEPYDNEGTTTTRKAN